MLTLDKLEINSFIKCKTDEFKRLGVVKDSVYKVINRVWSDFLNLLYVEDYLGNKSTLVFNSKDDISCYFVKSGVLEENWVKNEVKKRTNMSKTFSAQVAHVKRDALYLCNTDTTISDIMFKQGDMYKVVNISYYKDGKNKYTLKAFTKDTKFEFILCTEDTFLGVFEEIENNQDLSDKVNHPSHYTWLKELCGIEVIDITRHMDFDLGNAIKYILRAGHKSELGYSNKEKTLEDLRKAVFYINDEIKTLENE